jgi:predicted Fe-Mo cluster-binding NifX family protein
MILCVPVTSGGLIAPGWGRAPRVAVVSAADGQIGAWDELDVGWDKLHDEGSEGSHHARVARFLNDHHVEAVVVAHMGPGMTRMLTTMGIRVVLQAQGDARAAVLTALDPAG